MKGDKYLIIPAKEIERIKQLFQPGEKATATGIIDLIESHCIDPENNSADWNKQSNMNENTNTLESIDLELIECDGIPITPEILEKCGFRNGLRKSLGWYYLETNFGRINYFLESSHLTIGSYENKEEVLIARNKFQHLHQLQNLYFALTGEELEVNL